MESEPKNHVSRTKITRLVPDTKEMIKKYFGENKKFSSHYSSDRIGGTHLLKTFNGRSNVLHFGVRGKVGMVALMSFGILGTKDKSTYQNSKAKKIPPITDVQKFKALLEKTKSRTL